MPLMVQGPRAGEGTSVMTRRFRAGRRLATPFAVVAVVALGALAFVPPALSAAVPAQRSAVSSGGWTAARLPLPVGGATNSFQPLAISCASTTQCAGGGRYRSTTGQSLGALVTLSGKSWFADSAPLPAGAAANPEAAVASVSCPTAGACFAGGEYRTGSGSDQAMVLAWAAGTWSAITAPLPANASPNPDAAVYAMTCRSPSWCIAVGQYGSYPDQYGLILKRSGNKWTPAAAPVPAGSEAVASLDAVACASVTRCFAAGWQDAGQQPLMLTWSGKKWTVAKIALPAHAAANPQAMVKGIACPSLTRCVAVGYYQDAHGRQEGMLLTWSGKSWTTRQAPLPANGGPNPWVDLNAVSCPSSSRCTVGGGYENAASTPLGLLLTWSGSSWKATEAPTIAYNIYGVSCPSVTRCFAISWGIGRPVILTGP